MTALPESPQEHMERRIAAICTNLYGVFGNDANHPHGLRARADIWMIAQPHGSIEPTCNALQEVLDQIHEKARIESNTLGLWDGEREVRPRDHDYSACKAHHLDIQDGMILIAIRQGMINNQ